MTLSIEILVHISGSSRGSDDARYRKEAQELLEFEPVRRHEVLSLQRQKDGAYKFALKQDIAREMDKTPTKRPVGSVNALSSSFLQRLDDTTPHGECAGVPPFAVPVPLVPGSTKSNTAVRGIGARPTPQLLIEQTPALPRRTTPTAAIPIEATLSRGWDESDSWKTPPGVIPDSQASCSPIGRRQISSSLRLKRALPSASSPSPTRGDSFKYGKRQRIQEAPSESSAQGRAAESGATSVFSSSREAAHENRLLSSSDGLPLEIRPPRPRPSKAQFKTHLMPSLQTLSTALPLAKYFTPSSQTRSLDKLERGHWSIPIKSWDEALVAKFWQFLAVFISEGRAGWGVWCSMELESNRQNTGSNKENKDPDVREEVVKVYCWGEVVGEMWLVLFLASARKVRGVGARWIDAQGETMIQMI